jgi:RHS repeat-associated protein
VAALVYFTDNLGTSREIVQAGQTLPCNDADFYPFGRESTVYTNTCPQNYKFTGKERDETNLDNFGARYDSSQYGRFMTPDSPSYSNHKNPQSWNLYAYALNNPVTFRAADGHKIDCANNTQQCQADAAASTANAQAAARVTTQTTTTQHSFLGIFHWTTSETQIAITGDINSFRALSPNASKLADLVTSKNTVTVSYDQFAKPSFWANGVALNGGSTSYTPSQGYGAQAFIDPTRTPGAVYDQNAVDQGIHQANTGEEFGHEVLGHIWGEMFGGAPAGTRGNMRDSIIGENAVRALDPTRGQKGVESHHNYNEMPPDPPKPQ